MSVKMSMTMSVTTSLTMSMTLLITCLALLLPLDGVCGSDSNITREAADVNSVHSTSGHFNGTDVSFFDNEPYRPDRNYQRARNVVILLFLAVGVAGVCGNVVVLVAWCAETAYNPTVFLIKCLAVSDILLLILWCEYVLRFFRLPLLVLFYFRMVTAHTTLGVVVTRWVAVHKPLRAHSLLTKRRMVVGYVLMLLWCLIPLIFVAVYLSGNGETVEVFIVIKAVEGVYLALPILLLVALNVSLILKLRSLLHNFSLCQQQQQQQQQSQQQQPMVQLQYLVKAVLCVSISTALVYPAGIVCRAVFFPGRGLSTDLGMFCGIDCKMFWSTVSLLLEAINSSVNIIYYCLYASRFRQLCRRGCRRCRCCRWQSEDCLERQSDVMQMTVQSGVQ